MKLVRICKDVAVDTDKIQGLVGEENNGTFYTQIYLTGNRDFFVEGYIKDIEELINESQAGQKEANESIKLLGEELRKVREGITDEKVLIGFNMAIAICNKYFGESEE